MRQPSIIQAELLAESPIGFTRNLGSIWAKKLLPAATEASLIEKMGEALHSEIDPRSAYYLLSEWGGMFPTDPYGVDLSGMTADQLQLYYYGRLTSRGGQSIAFFEALAASYGIDISIQESPQTVYGDSVYGGDVYCESPNQFQWLVILPQTSISEATYGSAQYGDPYGTIAQSPLVPIIQALKPAHTQVTFSYTG